MSINHSYHDVWPEVMVIKREEKEAQKEQASSMEKKQPGWKCHSKESIKFWKFFNFGKEFCAALSFDYAVHLFTFEMLPPYHP